MEIENIRNVFVDRISSDSWIRLGKKFKGKPWNDVFGRGLRIHTDATHTQKKKLVWCREELPSILIKRAWLSNLGWLAHHHMG
jgi:hypothetical protein